MIEKYPLMKVAEAYHRMTRGKARFRAALTMNLLSSGPREFSARMPLAKSVGI